MQVTALRRIALLVMSMINDAHCHFFSTPFFAPLGGDAALATLGWDAPGTPEALADRWVAELDRHQVSRAALIASVPGDAASVAAAVRRHRERFVGFFMVDPTQPDAAEAASETIAAGGLRDDLPVPRHAPLLHPGRPGEGDVRRRGGDARDRGVRALRRAVGRRAQETRPAEPLRHPLRQPARSPRRRTGVSAGADHRPALRRRPVARGVDARGPLSQRTGSTRRARTPG